MSYPLVASPLSHALGLALIRFVWQGAMLGAAGALLLLALRRASARLRYVTACLTLAAMVGTVAVTFASLAREFSIPPPAVSEGAPSLKTIVAAPVATPEITIGRTTALPTSAGWIDARYPWIVGVWAAGVLFFAIRLLRAWIMVQLVRRGARPIAAGWPDRIGAIRAALGVTRRIRVLESALVDVPSVIGWLRPIVLIPMSALAGLPPAQFDAVLAHELAHVRRHDYLVNLLQSVAETLLFYHPAVWWMSRQIRREREHCCDDLAVSVCGDELVYAAALTSLEALRAGAPALAMGAQSGDLTARIRRLVAPELVRTRRAAGWVPLAAALATVFIGAGMRGQSAARETIGNIDQIKNARNISEPLPEPATVRAVNVATRPTTVARVLPASGDAAPRVESFASTPQAGPGSILGMVSDAQGGRIPGATVTVTSGNGPPRTVVTNAPGLFQITGLEPGVYDVRVAMPGFKTSTTRVQVGPAEARLKVTLELGGLSETVNVRRDSAGAAAGVTPADPRGPNDFLDLAQQYLAAGRTTDAAAMTARALDLMRTQTGPPIEIDSTPNAPVRIGGDIREPRKVRDVRPVYPAGADANLRGIVILEAIIAKDGTVRNVQILRSVPGLDDAALEAVGQWVFTPTLLNGVPVEVVMTVTVNFSG